MVAGKQILLFIPEYIEASNVAQQGHNSLAIAHPWVLLFILAVDGLVQYYSNVSAVQIALVYDSVEPHPPRLQSPKHLFYQAVHLAVECVARVHLQHSLAVLAILLQLFIQLLFTQLFVIMIIVIITIMLHKCSISLNPCISPSHLFKYTILTLHMNI